MIFDELELPKDQGADDYHDSCRLAGMMAIFDHSQAPDMLKYFTSYGKPVRHPTKFPANNPNNFTRDQLIPLAAGLWSQSKTAQASTLYYLVKAKGWFAPNIDKDFPNTPKKFPDGPDWIDPSTRMHLKLCAGFSMNEITKLEKLWMRYSIIINAKYLKHHEQNQTLCKAIVAGPEYIYLWKSSQDWKQALHNYWSGWRQEKEFAEFMIAKLEAI